VATDRKRGFETSGDMLRSMAVVGIVVAALIVLTYRQYSDPAAAIDVSNSLRGARAAAAYQVLAPETLPAGWRATSARSTPDGRGVHWHLGLLTTGKEHYVAVEQSDGADPRFVREQTENGQALGEVELAGRRWQQLRSDAKKQNSLVSSDGGVETVVTGTASFDELKRFTLSLRGG
jgi:hypothetical protein